MANSCGLSRSGTVLAEPCTSTPVSLMLSLRSEDAGLGREARATHGDRIRWWKVFRWIVIYDPVTSPVTILRVVHGLRDLHRILPPGPADLTGDVDV